MKIKTKNPQILRAMKTQKIIFAAIISIIMQSSALADGFKLKEESYIDDIPFNTTEIFYEILAADTSNLFLPSLNEEAFIDDIPFDTHEIAEVALSSIAMEKSFKMPEEGYIDDIPFNTESVAAGFCKKVSAADIHTMLMVR
ncbi:MAG: hypothetical protein Q8J88_09895 [Bacteroidales bacterium]|nr:hypothetical protein [Bacteroidales bacterium]